MFYNMYLLAGQMYQFSGNFKLFMLSKSRLVISRLLYQSC
jgi:hypothetical protein